MTRTQTMQRLSASVVVGLVLILGFAATTVHAAQPERRVALVIGNADYVSSSDLNNPANDARAMAQKLQSLGFTLVGGEAHVDVTRDGMLGLLDELRGALDAQTSSEAATALVYYSGHGVAEAGSNWLVPVDDGAIQYREDVTERAIGARSVMSRLEGRGGGLNILILDACRNNPLPSRSKTRGALSKGLGRMDAPSNTMIVYAAAPGKVAYDGVGELSPFTGALLSEMDRPGRRLEDVLGATAAAVREETAGMSLGPQEPWLEMQPLQRPFYFVPDDKDPPPPPPDEAKNAYETALKENTIAAYQAVVKHYPGFYATLAQKKIEELEAAERAAERQERRQALAEKLGREFSPEAVGENGWTDLHYAAALDLPGLTKELVEQGIEVDVRLDDSGEPFGDGLKRTLRELGQNFDGWTSDGDTPLHLAARNDALSVAQYLVGQGADVHAQSKNGWTPLQSAAENDALSVAQYLVGQGADVHVKDNDGGTPLHYAASGNALSVAEYLVGQGADVHATERHGRTPLHYAASGNALSVAEYLVGQGADVNAKRNIPDSRYYVPARGGTPLHVALLFEAQSVAKYLVEQGADVNAKDNDGRTPLHYAAWRDALSIVEYLVSQDAELQATTSDGGTLLHSAAEGRALSVAEYLVGQGADMHAKDNDGLTPLHYAARRDALSVAQYLVALGADVHAKDNNRNRLTPLHWAAWNNALSVVEYLVGQGADVNVKVNNGGTPLHYAALQDALSVVEYLVGQGADIDAEAKDGDTPLHWAVMKDAVSVAEYLVDQGANVDATNNFGTTPLDLAAEKGVIAAVLRRQISTTK